MNGPGQGGKRSWLINGALLVGSLVVSLALAELVLRAIDFSNPVLWTYDDVTGSKLFAGAEGWYREEGVAYIKVNRDGLRDRDHDKAKPPNTVRIAVLGDSMTEALQLPQEEAYWAVLERQLKGCKAFGDRQVEVINFGVSGYGTAQELLTYRTRALAYAPDITVLGFYAGNDVRNNSRTLEPSKLRPFFSVRDGKLVADNDFLRDPEYLALKANFDQRRWLFHLRTFQLVRKLKFVYDQWRGGEAVAARATSIEPGLNNEIFLPPATPAWTEAWQTSERLIAALRDEVQAGGGKFLAVSIPSGIQLHLDPKVRKEFAAALHVDDLWYPEARMRDFAARENIDMITFDRSWEAVVERGQAFWHGFKNTRPGTGHLNEYGHRQIGELIAKRLCTSDPGAAPAVSSPR